MTIPQRKPRPFQFSLLTLLIVTLLIGSLPLLFTCLLWVSIGVWFPDVFRGEMDVVETHSTVGPQFKVTQKFGDFYGWTLWYKRQPADRWKIWSYLENDGPRLSNATLTYDWESDKLIFRSGLKYKSEIVIQFDGNHKVWTNPVIAPAEP